MVVTYILNVVWMGVTSLCAVPIVIFVMLHSICQWEIVDREIWYYENYCFNLSRFGEYVSLKLPGITQAKDTPIFFTHKVRIQFGTKSP